MSDLISRQAAIDALKNDMASLDHIIKGMSANDVRLDAYVSQRNQVNYDIYTINNLPTAQPKHGKWVWNGDTLDWEHLHYCSECKKYALRDTDGKEMLSDFCPSCGADMRDEQGVNDGRLNK